MTERHPAPERPGRSGRAASAAVAAGAARASGERARRRRRTTPLLADLDQAAPLPAPPPPPTPPPSPPQKPAARRRTSGAKRLVAVKDAETLAEQVGDELADAASSGASTEELGQLDRRIASLLTFLRRRLTGDYEIDEFGFDKDLTESVLLSLLRPLYRRWFRVEVRGMDNVPASGGALIVANHAGAIALDSLMVQVAVHDEHPAHRNLRMLGADLVFSTPVIGELSRKAGATLADNVDAERLLAGGELVGVWPEGFKGIGKPFSERYKLQRFGRGGFVSAALRTSAPIVPCAIVGSEETYPIIGDMPALARLLGLPYAPITPTWPLLGPLGAIPLPSKWLIEFAQPVATDEFPEGSSEDPMLVFDLTDQVRQTIQQSLYQLLIQRQTAFF